MGRLRGPNQCGSDCVEWSTSSIPYIAWRHLKSRMKNKFLDESSMVISVIGRHTESNVAIIAFLSTAMMSVMQSDSLTSTMRDERRGKQVGHGEILVTGIVF